MSHSGQVNTTPVCSRITRAPGLQITTSWCVCPFFLSHVASHGIQQRVPVCCADVRLSQGRRLRVVFRYLVALTVFELVVFFAPPTACLMCLRL